MAEAVHDGLEVGASGEEPGGVRVWEVVPAQVEVSGAVESREPAGPQRTGPSHAAAMHEPEVRTADNTKSRANFTALYRTPAKRLLRNNSCIVGSAAGMANDEQALSIGPCQPMSTSLPLLLPGATGRRLFCFGPSARQRRMIRLGKCPTAEQNLQTST